MKIDNIGDMVNELETYDEWQNVSIGFRNGRPCILIHNDDPDDVSGCIFLPEYKRFS